MTGAREGWRGGARTERSRSEEGGIVMLGQRQVMPRWEDNPIWRHVVGGGVGAEGGFPLGRKSGIRKTVRGGSSKQVRNHQQYSLGYGGVTV